MHALRGCGIYWERRRNRERSVMRKMIPETIYGDVDDMIFADCDWHPSER